MGECYHIIEDLVPRKTDLVFFSLQVRKLRHLSAGAVREPGGGGDVPADEDPRRRLAQGRQLHHGHPRLQEEIRGPRALSIRPAQEVRRVRNSGKEMKKKFGFYFLEQVLLTCRSL